jgi:hypothetical protein
LIGCVVGFDEINKTNIRGEIVVALRVEKSFEGEESVSTAEFRGASKLESGTMFVE